MLYGLKQNTIISIKNIFKKYPQIEKVILYGSRAIGNYTNGSDIDLTIVSKAIKPINRTATAAIPHTFFQSKGSSIPSSFTVSVCLPSVWRLA